MKQEKEYYAFISYKREDEKWAKWLQNKLEHYRFPTNLNGRTDLPKYIRPTFRDVTDLKPGLLAEEINNAICNSEWLIVICSPRSAKSPWVCKEAQIFIDLGCADHIIPFIIEGKPFSDDVSIECYPEALLNLRGSRELLAANINEMGRDAAVIKVVARMFNLRFDSLWQRYERERKRKRWMWIVGSILIALFGLGLGAYFVKQNRTIEIERNNVLRANASLNVTLMKTYLSQNRPEMALVVLNDIESNVHLLDSMQIIELFLMKENLCDSILTSPMLLVNISDAEERKPLDYATLFKNSEVVDIHHVDDRDVLHIHDKESNRTDTISGLYNYHFITNCGLKHIAAMEYRDGKNNELDTIYTPEEGIRIYSLLTGKIERFVSIPLMDFGTCPISLSNDGKFLIYNEHRRWINKIWFVNFDKGQRIPMNTSYLSLSDDVISAFSPNDKWFYLYHPEKKEIRIRSSKSLKEIHTFRYEDCDSVYWDSSNNICIDSKGKTYSWKVIEKKSNRIFKAGSMAHGVNISKQYAAAACDNGRIYIWDILSGKTVFEKEIMDAPEDVAFTKDATQLWVISGYNCVKSIDLNSKSVKSIFVEDPQLGPPHPWSSYLYMTKDGEHCISHCYYGNQYTLFNLKGNIIESVFHYDDFKNELTNDVFSEFVFPEEFDYDPELIDSPKNFLTARRITSDGKMCIEGFSNGTIKVFSIQDRNTINSLTMGDDGQISKNRMEYDKQ